MVTIKVVKARQIFDSRGNPTVEVSSFLAVALFGLGLTTLLMYMLTAWVRLAGVTAKLITAPIVLAWNFLGRRFFVFQPDMPIGTADLSARLFSRLRRIVPIG